MFTLLFWRQTFERAVKTAAQFVLGAGIADLAFNVFTADWKLLLGVALGGAVLSAVTSLASVAITGNDTPDLTTQE